MRHFRLRLKSSFLAPELGPQVAVNDQSIAASPRRLFHLLAVFP
jgi:hypothetical protein